MACEVERLTTRSVAGTQPELLHHKAVIPNRVLLLAHRYRGGARTRSFDLLREINVTKIFVVALAFGAALAVLPAAAQTGYGVKKNAPSTSTFDRGWNHANQSKDRARAGAAYVRRHHASPFRL
jgi:hypothetical protein